MKTGLFCASNSDSVSSKRTSTLFLAPLDEPRFEVDLALHHLVDIQVLLDHRFEDELFGYPVPLIQVDGTDKRFQGVPVDVGVVGQVARGGDDELVDSQVHGQLVQGLPLYDARAHVREEPLFFVFKPFVQDIGDDGIENGVAQELKAFVIDPLSLARPCGRGAVRHGFQVEINPIRVEPEDMVKGEVRLFPW